MHLISQKATFVEKNHKIWRACLSVASLHNQLKVSEPTVPKCIYESGILPDAYERFLDAHNTSDSDQIQIDNRNYEAQAPEIRTKLCQLRSAGAISNHVYQMLEAAIDSRAFPIDINLFASAANFMREFERFELKNITPFLNEMVAMDILSEGNRARLLHDLEIEQPNGIIELLRYTDQGLLIDFRDYPRDFTDYLTQIFQAMTGVLKEIGAVDVSFNGFDVDLAITESESNPPLTLERGHVTLKLQVEGQVYQQRHGYSSISTDMDALNLDPEDPRFSYLVNVDYGRLIGTENTHSIAQSSSSRSQLPLSLTQH